MPERQIEGKGFTVKESKFDFFFGRVTSNTKKLRRSSDNLENLNLLGIDEAADGRERLIEIFQEGLNAPEIEKGRKLTKYGLNISRKVELSYGKVEGAIVVRYFYPNGDLSVKPQVTSIVVLIYK